MSIRSIHAHGAALPLAALAVLAALAATAPACDARGEAPEPVVLLDLEGREVRAPRIDGARASVYIFTRTDCPISNRYAPEVRRLYERFAPRDVAFRLVYVKSDEPAADVRKHLAEYAYPMAALRDPRHALVLRTGARVTPEAALFDGDGRLAYRGRIDDRYVDFGKARAAATRHDLELALEAVLEGRAVDEPTTDAVGCFIEDLR